MAQNKQQCVPKGGIRNNDRPTLILKSNKSLL